MTFSISSAGSFSTSSIVTIPDDSHSDPLNKESISSENSYLFSKSARA